MASPSAAARFPAKFAASDTGTLNYVSKAGMPARAWSAHVSPRPRRSRGGQRSA
jgi:hypothetical protein